MTRSYFAIVGRLKFGYNLTHKFKQRPSPTTIIIFFAGIVTVLDIWTNRAEIILFAIQNQKECFRQLDHPNVKFYARPDFSKIKIHWLLQKYPVQSTNGFTFTPYMYAHTHTKENDFKCRYQNLQPIKDSAINSLLFHRAVLWTAEFCILNIGLPSHDSILLLIFNLSCSNIINIICCQGGWWFRTFQLSWNICC